ncbi:MAG TPA: Druantia anti-phage system protein DruA [Thermoanaerobaculia bacterium]|jgi:hypothetical protein|nr:Druantia anti-phage system protein DruA [Thermoanaerobaculia bacterium]
MNCQVFPRVEGIALERFRALAKQVMQYQRAGESGKFEDLRRREVDWAKHQAGLNGAREEYEALARVLIDLAKLRWRVEEDRFGIELLAPYVSNGSRVHIGDYKEMVRNELAPQLAEQFADEAARKFIRQMEAPRASTKKKPVTMLIADGGELRARLLEATEAHGAERVHVLEGVVQPYLQLVEPDGRDEFTGQRLSDVWRYFRYTWTIPATNIPGRQLNYLVRDAAHPHHAIIGIAALSNSPLQMRERDTALGWTREAFTRNVDTALSQPNASATLSEFLGFLEHCIDRALAAVDWSNLVSEAEVVNPTEDVVARLRRRAGDFASRRAEALKGLSEAGPLVVEELEGTGPGEPPVSDDVLRLEQKVFGDPSLDSARRAMVAKKRAALIARSLQARLSLRRCASSFTQPTTALSTLAREDFSSAVATALEGIKHLCVGANMLEITTCGAVAPYNSLLGGKLVSLLMLSPEVADDYRKRYGSEPAIISSMMKNSRVVPDTRLVFLGTTSLYAHGASQYNRLRLPRGIIAPDQDEIRFESLGYTGGFGTVQFPDDTAAAVRKVLEKDEGFSHVNSIFGEGRSPKFRMLRSGLRLLGFDPETVMQHHQRRRIYGIRLCPQAVDFLLGKIEFLPNFIERPEQFRDATSRISAFWRERWLASRIEHTPTLEVLRKTPSWKLSERIPVERKQQTDGGGKPPGGAPPRDMSDATIEFWRTFAHAGPSVCSDELSTSDLDRLNIATSLENFLVAKVRMGFSLVLTGNAGDGKTHLLRKLAPELRGAGAEVDLDATALMRRGSVEPILNRWRAALAASRPYCLAANEYPLYLLRLEVRKSNALEWVGSPLHKVLSEVERQCNQRLAYGGESTAEDAQEKVLVVDLSLRNPLASEFSGPALDKILTEPALQGLAASGTDTDFTWNFRHLSHPIVRSRLIALFDRLVDRGGRCTVRELWILLARLLFNHREDIVRPVQSPSTWYSERLFETDQRFALVAKLKQDADPAGVSHPQWDFRLEDADGTKAEDWLVDGKVPTLDRRELETARGVAHFAALKRRFYFEHRNGDQAFTLEPEDAVDFSRLLENAREPDDVLRRKLVRALNMCFCPIPFHGCEDAFWLWIGHRFHEQPSRCFLANQSVHATDFQIWVPRLPRRLAGAWAYRPDHLILEYQPSLLQSQLSVGEEPCRLMIDFALWSTLHKLRTGFPRHLASERELNRVDAFLNKILRTNPPQGRVFVVFNNENRLVTRVTLTNDYRQYTDIEIC